MLLTNESSGFINFLRAISSQTVMVMHALLLNNLVLSSSPYSALHCFSVMIFFVISGFVISNSIHNKGVGYGFKNYLIDRFSRIYILLIPVNLLFLLLALLFYLYVGSLPYPINLKFLLGNLFMQQENLFIKEVLYRLPENYNFTGLFANNIPLWSLSIEWWNYVFIGLVFFKKWKQYNLIHYILLIFSLCFVVGFSVFPSKVTYGLTFVWFVGVLIQYLLKLNLKVPYLGAVALTFLVLTILVYDIAYPFAIVFFALFFLLSLLYFQSNKNQILNQFFRPFNWFSNYSFSIYIIHYPILLIALCFIKNPIHNFIFVFLVSNMLSFLFYRLFESKHKALAIHLKRFFK
jgi:peptidoglycan/LPS O-acetylase OafA/YrhL